MKNEAMCICGECNYCLETMGFKKPSKWRRLKVYFTRKHYVPNWLVWLINIYVGILALKWFLIILIKLLKLFI